MTNKKNQVVRLDEVKQAWAVTFSKHADFSKNIVAKRILTMALHKIGIKAQKGDIDIANLATEDLTVNFTVKQYLSATDTGKGTSKSYFGLIKKGIEVLASVTVTMHNKETDKWFVVNVLDTSEKNVTNGHLGNGEYRILFNPVFLAVAGDLKQFSTFDFVGYMQLDSFYNQRLYELLSAWRDTGEWYVSVEDFAKHLGIKKPMRYPNMEQRVIAPAKEKFKGSELAFDFEKVYTPMGVGRPRVSHLKFILLKAMPPEEYVKKCLAHKDLRYVAMTKAMQGYGFDDRSIMRYWKNIDPKVIAQINFDIKTKMSEKKIKNTKAYARTCYENAFDIAIAQKMGEEVKQFA